MAVTLPLRVTPESWSTENGSEFTLLSLQSQAVNTERPAPLINVAMWLNHAFDYNMPGKLPRKRKRRRRRREMSSTSHMPLPHANSHLDCLSGLVWGAAGRALVVVQGWGKNKLERKERWEGWSSPF